MTTYLSKRFKTSMVDRAKARDTLRRSKEDRERTLKSLKLTGENRHGISKQKYESN